MNNTPKLRFKDENGENYPEWEEHRFKNLVTFEAKSKYPASIKKAKGPFRFILSSTSSDKWYCDTPLLNKEAIIINDGGEANFVYMSGEYAYSDHCIAVSTNENTKYLYYYLDWKRRIIDIQGFTGSGLRNIDREYLKNFKINLPSIPEQEKIASFLSLFDKKIELQEKKVDSLKEYKKGMMQKMFSQELRFKDENRENYPDWEVKNLGDIGDTYTGLSGKTKENFGKGQASYVTYTNIFNNTKIKEELNDLVEVFDNEKQNQVLKGDLFFTASSETPNEVGRVSVCEFERDNLYLNSFCFGYRIKNKDVYKPLFLSYMLRGDECRRKISVLAQGSTRYNLSKTELMRIKIKLPSIPEQEKIASLLSTIDKKIELEEEKLEELKEYKKGLLQQMFV